MTTPKRTEYSYTSSLREILKTASREDFYKIHEAIDFHAQQYEETKANSNGASAAYSLMVFVEPIINEGIESSKKKVSCGKGCTFCCRMNVDITEDEAELLVMACADNNIDIDMEKVSRQASKDTWEEQEPRDKGCVFLDQEGGCSVYEVRPMNCRRHLVASPPQDCDTENNPNGDVLRLFNFEPEVISTAIMTVSKSGSLPKMILATKSKNSG